jgi:hypothetical protein
MQLHVLLFLLSKYSVACNQRSSVESRCNCSQVSAYARCSCTYRFCYCGMQSAQQCREQVHWLTGQCLLLKIDTIVDLSSSCSRHLAMGPAQQCGQLACQYNRAKLNITYARISGSCACRCKTCAVTSSSAVCVSCFKAGGHEHHDYIMYR